MENHTHRWRTNGVPDQVSCSTKDCNTVSSLQTLLHNTKKDAADQAKIEVLVTQLRNGDLRKGAHDVAYAFVRKNGHDIPQPAQESFI